MTQLCLTTYNFPNMTLSIDVSVIYNFYTLCQTRLYNYKISCHRFCSRQKYGVVLVFKVRRWLLGSTQNSSWLKWQDHDADTFNPIFKMVKLSRYRPGVAQRVGRGIALLFHDRGTRRGWVVSSTPRPHLTPGKDPLPIVQEVGWTPGPVWTGGNSRPHRDSIPDRPARSQLLYRPSYRAH